MGSMSLHPISARPTAPQVHREHLPTRQLTIKCDSNYPDRNNAPSRSHPHSQPRQRHNHDRQTQYTAKERSRRNIAFYERKNYRNLKSASAAVITRPGLKTISLLISSGSENVAAAAPRSLIFTKRPRAVGVFNLNYLQLTDRMSKRTQKKQ
ncbi:unnamed protein product [Colias eurytheme]|nr:unnamed protein product [Colias eurytheme]